MTATTETFTCRVCGRTIPGRSSFVVCMSCHTSRRAEADAARGAPSPPAERRRKRPPSALRIKFRVFQQFTNVFGRNLSNAAQAVWVALWFDSRSDGKNATARTAVTALAARTGNSTRTVTKALRELREGGFLEPERRGVQWIGPTVYRLILPGSKGAPECA